VRSSKFAAWATGLILAPWFLLYLIVELVLHAFNIPHPHIR
jgi:hypothetical protein